MARARRFTAQDDALRFAMYQDLIGVRTYEDIHVAIESRIAQLCRADHLAVGFANLDGSVGLEWKTTTAMPLLKDYSEWAPRDFVFQSTVTQPNIVLNDTQMLRGLPLERTETYQRSRDARLRLEHVMAALLFEDQQGLKGGLAVYSESRPFSELEQSKLQALIPVIKAAVTSVQHQYAVRFERDLMKALSLELGAAMVLTAMGRELVRTEAATRRVSKWFAPSELGAGGVPEEWATRVKRLSSMDGPPEPEWTHSVKNGNGEQLFVTFTPSTVLYGGRLTWQLRIEERVVSVLQGWRESLTPKEREVAECLLKGLANKDIAGSVECSEQTVKKHVASIFRKVGVGSRAEFIALALS
ncbi:helix-turn-helix transcriptional regulator [Corallococcus sp. Z5C101001]|nr:helix-turn-helix transcriptional regulator [Corallococcus sp. Z5C101001]